MGQGGARCKVADRVTLRWRRFRNRIRDLREGQADTILLYPGDPALVHNRGILRHYQAEVPRHEGRVVDIDRRALVRDIPHHAGHDGTARRNIARFVSFRSRILSFLFHAVRPVPIDSDQTARLVQNLKQVGRVRRSVRREAGIGAARRTCSIDSRGPCNRLRALLCRAARNPNRLCADVLRVTMDLPIAAMAR